MADVNGDGGLEVLIASDENIYIWKKDGSEFIPPIYVQGLEAKFIAPLIADVDEDNDLEIIVTSNGGYGATYCYDIDGERVMGWPLRIPGIFSTPCIDDIDNDGKNEIIATGGNEVHVWDTEGDAGRVEWGKYRHDRYNSGVYGDFCPKNSDPITITGVTEWIDNRILQSDVIIEPGGKLTIYENVALPEGAKIIIEQGALVLDGCNLTKACTGNWAGIVVWGNPSLPQIPPNQGWLVITNGGTIENAEVAVRLGSEEHSNYGGGIVIASGATFINNTNAVRFDACDGFYNVSVFTGCTFEYNKNISGEPNLTHVLMNDVKNVRFNNCTFANNSNYNRFGYGINSINSTFSVGGVCTQSSGGECIEWDPSEFENLEYAIHATASTSTRRAYIQHTNFTDNFRGVFLSAMTNALVKECDFEINTPYSADGGYGLYLDNSTAYTIEENSFYHDDGLIPTGIGMIVHNSGGNPNEVFRNWFTNLEQGISAQEINRNFDEPAHGLQILCCEFTDCIADILVPKSLERSWGIAPSQGSYNPFNPDPEDMAGNLFHIPNQTPDGDFDDINNAGSHVTYYYPSDNNDSRAIPVDYTANTVTPTGCSYNPDWTFEAGCPPNENGGSGSEEEMRGNLGDANQDIEATVQNLTILVDGGDTETLNTEVSASIPPETVEVYNELMGKSPYLSDTVVSSAIAKEDVLPNVMLRDIMVANPQTAKSDILMDRLDERYDPLPGYMKAQILAGRSLVSLKEELESKLAKYRLKKARAMNGLFHHYKDPENVPGGMDSVLMLLQQDGDLQSKYRLAMLHLETGNYQQGENILNNLPAQYNLQGGQLVAHQDMEDFYSLATEVLASDNGWRAATPTQIQQLFALESAPASAYARNVLISIGEIIYEEPILMPDLLKSSEILEEYNKLLAHGPPSILEVYPNPAKDYLIIGYILDMTEVSGIVEIMNLKGDIVKTIPITEPVDKLTVLTQNWKSGTYIATMVVNGKIMDSIKFTLID